MVYWLVLRLVPRDAWLLVGALVALQLTGVDVIGLATDLASPLLPDWSISAFW